MLAEKNVFDWAASHSCKASFTSSELKRRPHTASLSGPKNRSPRDRDWDCMQEGPTPRNPVSQEFEQCRWQYVGTRRQAVTEHLFTIGLGVGSNWKLQFGTQHLTIPYTAYCCALFQIMFQYYSLWIPGKCEHHFPCRRLTLECLLHCGSRMFPFHALAFSTPGFQTHQATTEQIPQISPRPTPSKFFEFNIHYRPQFDTKKT
jgi:hypothetical protein